MKRAKKIIVGIVSVLLVIVLFFVAQRLVEPKYAEDILEGNFTAEYYYETTEHDVIMVGDCEVYENFDPIYLWKNFGITSYIRGNAQQLTWQSYYMLEDCLKYETPKVVIYNVQALTHAEPQREEYNRMTLDGMKWSQTKLDAIQASMCTGENLIDYVFPILRYHSRITSLNRNDFRYFADSRKVSHNGYYMRIDVLPVSQSDVADTAWLLGDEPASQEGEEDDVYDPWDAIPEDDEDADVWDAVPGEEEEEADPWDSVDEREGNAVTPEQPAEDGGVTFGKYPMKYLDKIKSLCDKHGIQLILIKAPSLAPQWFDTENAQVVEYAEANHLPYINFYDLLEETGIDYETDTYDGGLHMNLSGAEKLSEYLGGVLQKEYGMEDHRSDKTLKKVYDKKYRFHEQMKERQQEELERYGEIRSY